MKKLVALLLAAIMVFGIFAGCDTNKPVETQPKETKPAESKPTETQPKETEPNPFEEEVELVYVLPGTGEYNQDDLAAIEEELSKITKEKINATIKLEVIFYGEYTQKMNLKHTAGEYYDLCFTGAFNPYAAAVDQDAYAELTEELLNTYAPEYMAQLNPSVWNAVKIGGKIYGAPIEQIYVRQPAAQFSKDLVEKYNFDISKVDSLDDLTPYLKTIKENEDLTDLLVVRIENQGMITDMLSYYGMDSVAGSTTPGAIHFEGGELKAINQFASEEYKAYWKLAKEWYDAGLIDPACINNTAKGNKIAVRFQATNGPDGAVIESRNAGYDVVMAGLGDTYMTTSAINQTITAISAESEHIERCVAFINLLNTDKDVMNLLAHGIEGKDYKFVDEANGVIETISSYPGLWSWTIGCVFNEYYTDPALIGVWEATKEINATAKGSPALGFSFDKSSVTAEVAACQAVVKEKLPALNCGMVDDVDAAVQDLLTALEQAGANTIIEELNRQLEAWANAQ